MKHIHKLPFGVPSGVSALPLSTLENVVVKLYQETMQNENSLIAYKGGCFEKNSFGILWNSISKLGKICRINVWNNLFLQVYVVSLVQVYAVSR